MTRLITTIILALAASVAHAEYCVPSVLALSLAPIGRMHPGKSQDRPALVGVSPVFGLGAVWWCADGSVWEWHGTSPMIGSKWGDIRKAQAAYVADPAGVRAWASARPSCISKQSETRGSYCADVPTRPGYKTCISTLITDPGEIRLCQAVVRQAAEDWPK